LLAVHICALITGAALVVPWILVLPGWSLALRWLAAATSFLLACHWYFLGFALALPWHCVFAVMAIFNFLLFIGTVHDLVQHGTGCSLALLYPGSLLALYSRCAGSVHSVALYQRCNGYIYSLWHYPLTGFAGLAALYMLWLFPAPRWACIFAGFLLALHWCCAG
jgi:hypothetical protein